MNEIVIIGFGICAGIISILLGFLLDTRLKHRKLCKYVEDMNTRMMDNYAKKWDVDEVKRRMKEKAEDYKVQVLAEDINDLEGKVNLIAEWLCIEFKSQSGMKIVEKDSE